MVVFNRVLVIAIALVLLAGSLIALLVTSGAVAADIVPYNWFESTLERAANASGGTETTIMAVAAVIGLGAIGLLFLEFATLRKPASLIISHSEDGTVRIDRDSIRMLAERAAVRIRHVRDARCAVRGGAEGVSVSCQASLAWGSAIEETSAALRERISDELQQCTGLDVVQVNVKTEYEKLEARPVGRTGDR